MSDGKKTHENGESHAPTSKAKEKATNVAITFTVPAAFAKDAVVALVDDIVKALLAALKIRLGKDAPSVEVKYS